METYGRKAEGRSWKATEGHGMSRNTLEIPWNAVGTNDREVECHGRPWNSHVTSVGIPAQPPEKFLGLKVLGLVVFSWDALLQKT